jgi:hypothetical protein
LTQEDVPHFGRGHNSARKAYRQFFADGLEMGTRPELVGGGLLRSRTREDGREFQDSDEQILGRGAFVSSLRQEGYLVVIGSKGIQLALLAQRIAEYFNLHNLLQRGPRGVSGQFATRNIPRQRSDDIWGSAPRLSVVRCRGGRGLLPRMERYVWRWAGY